MIFNNFQCLFSCIHFWSKYHCFLLSNELHKFITNRWRSQWNRFYLWYSVYSFPSKRRSLKWTNYLDVTTVAFFLSILVLFVEQIPLFGDFVYREISLKPILAWQWSKFVYFSNYLRYRENEIFIFGKWKSCRNRKINWK